MKFIVVKKVGRTKTISGPFSKQNAKISLIAGKKYHGGKGKYWIVPYRGKKKLRKGRGIKVNQEKISYEELRYFFVKETGYDDKLINYSKLEKKFGKKMAYGFHERGLIYEPIRGKAKLI